MNANLRTALFVTTSMLGLATQGSAGVSALDSAASAAAASEVNSKFIGSNDAPYENASNWSPAQVPNNSQSASYNVTITDKHVPVSIDATISKLTLAATANIGAFNFPSLEVIDHAFTVTDTTSAPAGSRASFSVSAKSHSASLNLGTLREFANTILVGDYAVEAPNASPPATMRFNGANIVTLGDPSARADQFTSSSLVLAGPGASLVDENGNSALGNLARISPTGTLDLELEHILSLSHDLTNAGTIRVGGLNGNTSSPIGARLIIHGKLTNFAADTKTLTGGTYEFGGNPAAPAVLQFNGADIVNNAASISITGDPNGAILDENGNNALRNFSHNLAKGRFDFEGGSYIRQGNFTNDGQLFVEGFSDTRFRINGTLTNFNPATKTLSGGEFGVGGANQSSSTQIFQFPGADIVHNASRLSVAFGGQIQDEKGNDALRHLATNEKNASFLLSQAQLTVPGSFLNKGQLFLFGSSFAVPAAASYTQTDGETNFGFGGSTLTAAQCNITGGQIDGNGTVSGEATIGNATLGSFPGEARFFGLKSLTALNFQKNLSMSDDSHLGITLAGRQQGLYDMVSVDGHAAIAGVLDVVVNSRFAPAKNDTFTIVTAGGGISGSFSNVPNGGTVKTLDGSGSMTVTFYPDSIILSNFKPAPPIAKLLNISTRLKVETGDNALIGGFIVKGTSTKKVLVRGLGPSLTASGVPGALQDPTLELHDSTGAVVASNDNWKDTQETAIKATTIPPSNPSEAAIVSDLAPGAYTAIVRGNGDTTGVGLVEVYDLEQKTFPQLANISTRGLVGTGSNVLIGGLILGGETGSARVLIRAIGPSLRKSGVSNALPDTTLELHNGQGATIATNDNWKVNGQTGHSQEAAIRATTIPPSSDLESAVLATLAPGNYTAIVRGKNDTTGVALVEAYNLQ